MPLPIRNTSMAETTTNGIVSDSTDPSTIPPETIVSPNKKMSWNTMDLSTMPTLPMLNINQQIAPNNIPPLPVMHQVYPLNVPEIPIINPMQHEKQTITMYLNELLPNLNNNTGSNDYKMERTNKLI